MAQQKKIDARFEGRWIYDSKTFKVRVSRKDSQVLVFALCYEDTLRQSRRTFYLNYLISNIEDLLGALYDEQTARNKGVAIA
ncbi:MAG: hypothetical protein ACREHG_10460 [Candidatus Saccharimonadales bacterium]